MCVTNNGPYSYKLFGLSACNTDAMLHFTADSLSSIMQFNATQWALEANAFSVITQSSGHYNVQGHSRSSTLLRDFLLVVTLDLHPISHRFQVIADYRSKCALST